MIQERFDELAGPIFSLLVAGTFAAILHFVLMLIGVDAFTNGFSTGLWFGIVWMSLK